MNMYCIFLDFPWSKEVKTRTKIFGILDILSFFGIRISCRHFNYIIPNQCDKLWYITLLYKCTTNVIYSLKAYLQDFIAALCFQNFSHVHSHQKFQTKKWRRTTRFRRRRMPRNSLFPRSLKMRKRCSSQRFETFKNIYYFFNLPNCCYGPSNPTHCI